MSESIIEVDSVSKIYRLGDINTGTLSHDLNRWWAKVRGREDHYEALADGTKKDHADRAGYLWSLRDVSFSVDRGEVFGIIGKNGAGKSTMLKLLSRITKPSKGFLRLDGRIASLLEVGTGFHPDLTGRENVYLNGAILGMRRKDIQKRFDEIVAFSGVERFIDTPVKRYSSGMFVRLAFAVAAHLEPEILIIDEVLAVGDAEFQEKCLGKMRDVSRNQGRTVLFVSHNVAAVRQLCQRALLLENGMKRMVGSVTEVLEAYQTVEDNGASGVRTRIPEELVAYLSEWQVRESDAKDRHSCFTRENIAIDFHCRAFVPMSKCELHLFLKTEAEHLILHASTMDFGGHPFSLQPGEHSLRFRLSLPVQKGKYVVHAALLSEGRLIDSWLSNTRLVIMDTFEADARYPMPALLSLKTGFTADLLRSSPLSQTEIISTI